jgi:hypothetical protein
MANVKTTVKTEKKSNKGLIAGIVAAVVVAVIIVVVALMSNASKIVGKYKLTAFVGEDGTESTEMVSLLAAFGGSYTIEFKSDKTGVMSVTGGSETQSINFTYTDKLVKFEDDGETAETEYTLKDNVVTLKYEGQGMKFERETDKK